MGKYTISSSRVSTSSRLEQLDYNISNDKSLIGRELMMPDELMRFKFGESIFMRTRMHPIKAHIVPISEYPIKIKKCIVPKKSKKYDIVCFNLDEYRKEQTLNKNTQIELE